MPSLYEPQAKGALGLLSRKGQAMTIYRLKLDPAYDPVNPAASAPVVDVESPCVGIVLPASNGTIEAFDKRILDDPMQRRDFRFVILSGLTPDGEPLPFTPQALDHLLTNEGLYRLLGCTPLDPAGDGAIIYNLGCTTDVQIALP